VQLSLREHGFKEVSGYDLKIPECVCLLKKQTLNINRAVCVVELSELPDELGVYIKNLRNKVAFTVGFVPLLWGLGLQVVIICPNINKVRRLPGDFVAKVDNQWAIVQSAFFVDPVSQTFTDGRTWGQFITGKYQESISKQLQASYEKVET
jgi:hypothetical protein